MERMMLAASRTLQSRFVNAALIIFGAVSGGLSPAFHCGATYKAFSHDLYVAFGDDPPQLAALNRKALRFFDACLTGDLDDAAALFSRLHNEINSGHPHGITFTRP